MRQPGTPWLAGFVLLGVVAVLGCERGAGDLPPSPLPESPPQRSLSVRVTGHGFQWLIRYAGPDARFDTPDDVLTRRHLHVPARTAVAIDLRSEDYVYTLHVPDFDVIEAAIPDIPSVLEFETESPGTLELLGSQMCGYAHPQLLGDVVVHTPQGFKAWLAEAREQGRKM